MLATIAILFVVVALILIILDVPISQRILNIVILIALLLVAAGSWHGLGFPLNA